MNLNRQDFDGAIAHGEAFRYFARQQANIPALDVQAAWRAFLDGWLSKARALDDLRNRR